MSGQEPIEVVGAVITDEAGRVLCALRSSAMKMPGLWEFPGGKLDAGEAPRAALSREIAEELGCTIAVGGLVADCTHAYPGVTIRLRTYRAHILAGVPRPHEHERLVWLAPAELGALAWAPADLPTVEALVAASRVSP